MAVAGIVTVYTVIVLVNVKLTLGDVVPLGDAVKLSATKTCSDDKSFKLVHLLNKSPTAVEPPSLTVANRVNGVWKPEGSYTNRIQSSSSSSVTITDVNYNDGGDYEFICGGDLLFPVQVKVVVPSEIKVREEEAATLPCHHFTADKTVKRMKWTFNTVLVLELNLSSGEITYGTNTYKGNVSLGNHSLGDLSLSLKQARPEHQGLYQCSVQDEAGKWGSGDPSAVRLRIMKKPDQTSTSQPTTPATPANCGEKGVTGCIGCIVAVILVSLVLTGAIVAYSVYPYMKSRRSNSTSGPSDGTPRTDVDSQLLHNGRPGPQVIGKVGAANGPSISSFIRDRVTGAVV